VERHEYMEKIKNQLTEYNAKLSQLRSAALQAQTDMRREYLSQVKILESKRDKLREMYGHLKETSASTWEDAKEATEKAFTDFKEAFDKVIKHFKF